jgi:hypothetical protein
VALVGDAELEGLKLIDKLRPHLRASKDETLLFEKERQVIDQLRLRRRREWHHGEWDPGSSEALAYRRSYACRVDEKSGIVEPS